MAQIQPAYLIPIVGYFMWYLQAPRGRPPRQYTPDEILEKAMQNDEFAGVTPDEFRQAQTIALRNLQASELARTFDSAYYHLEE